MMKSIFQIKTEADFQQKCLETFHFQYENIEVYRKFIDFLKIDPNSIKEIEKIPFLPIEMFKNHTVLDQNKRTNLYFQSSGTTQMNLSKHWIADEKVYEGSIEKTGNQRRPLLRRGLRRHGRDHERAVHPHSKRRLPCCAVDQVLQRGDHRRDHGLRRGHARTRHPGRPPRHRGA